MELHKQYVVDENHNPIAVVIPIKEFKELEDLIEDYELGKLIEENKGETPLNLEEGLAYYATLPKRDE